MNNVKSKLSWRHLKALYNLYTEGKTYAKIVGNAFISQYLMKSRRLIRFRYGNHNILEAQAGYKSFYENHLKENYEYYEAFLRDNNLEYDARRRYDEDDIQTLMFIRENREQLRSNLTTVRKFSNTIFEGKGSKYLERHKSLKEAVCRLLDIDDFPDQGPKDHQWRFVVDTLNPQAVVLCENLDNLKVPWKAKSRRIELWYVGGGNTTILDDISNRYLDLPIFYACDWDHAGLEIYTRIRKILFDKQCKVKLLIPSHKSTLPVNSPNHYSEWRHGEKLSGLDVESFSEPEKNLIEYLIRQNKWIEEESFDIYELLEHEEGLFL